MLLSFFPSDMASAIPAIYRETVWDLDDDRVDWTFYVLPDKELLNAEPPATSNGVVTAQWFFEMPEGWLIPESFHVFSDFSNPLDSSLIDNPGLDPYTGEMIAGAVGHSNVTGQYESFTDAVFASFSSEPFEDGNPKPAFSFSTHKLSPSTGNGFALWSGGFVGQAGQMWDTGVLVEDYFGGAIPGDFNGNWQVEDGDLTLLLSNWGEQIPPIPAGWVSNLPSAPSVDDSELRALLSNWGQSGGPAVTRSTARQVPEPNSGLIITLLLGMALSAFGQRANHNCRSGSARRQS
ncbi:hypothetical protein [Aeoliella straminimaris]|nr:hypothetical protein [Aeoliella straminimaris]